MDLTDVKIRIKEHEGFCLEPYNLEYKTSDGTIVKEDFQTGGYGHVIQKGEEIPTTREGCISYMTRFLARRAPVTRM